MKFGSSRPAGTSLGLNLSGTTSGTDVTASTTVNTMGAWVSLGTSPAYPVNKLTLLQRQVTNNNYGTALINIGFGASGSQVVIIPNIAISLVGISHTTLSGVSFPCPLPPGTEVWAQVQATVASTVLSITAELDYDSEWEPSGLVVPIGIDTSTSSGTIISSGSNNALTTTALFTTPAQPFRGFVTLCTTQATGYWLTLFWRIVTSGGVPLTPYKRLIYNGGSDSTQLMGSFHLSPLLLPPSTALSLQYQSESDGTGLPINVALYGIP